MKINSTSILPMFLLISGLTVSGCTSLYDDENHGSKVQLNSYVQTVNPGASKEPAPLATLEGQKAEMLMKRYHKEQAEVSTEKLLKDIGSSD